MVIGMNPETKSKKLNLRWLAYLALVLVSFIQPPSVKSAEIHVNQTSDVAIITVTGELELGDHLRFIKAVLPVGRGIVVLGSEGGNLQAGIEIGKAIRLKDLTTYVPDDILCASACALAWLGGTQRFMAANAKIGFHAAFRMQNGSPTESGLGNALVGAYLNSLGLSQRAVAFISSADPRSMQWLTIENASQNGIEVGRLNLNENRSSRAQTARPNISTQPASRSTPQFGHYPAGYWHQGLNADVDLSGPAWNYRTRLRRAAQLKPNFGGKYIVVEWGCGTECVTGAIIDAPTGRVTFLPFNVCCSKSSDPNFSAIEFRIESRLLIFTGMLSENTPIAKHFYHFDGTSFHSIGMIEDNGNFSKSGPSATQPAPAPTTPSPARAPAQAGPAKPALVGQFGDWGAFATPQSKARTCYALSQPKTRMPANLTRDPAYIFVSHRPAERVRNEIAIIMGFDVKPDSKPMAEIGDEKFELVAKGPYLWLRNASDEAKFIAGIRKGGWLVLKAHSLRNHLTTDTYSLSGTAQALDRSIKECP